MVHHIVLYKLNPEVTPARVEEMMMNARMQLLKIPEVLSIKCGKRIDPENPWPFFRSEEHTSELQSRQYLVCRLLLEKKKKNKHFKNIHNILRYERIRIDDNSINGSTDI